MGPEPGLDRWVEFASVYSKGANISRSSGHLEDSQETEDIKVGCGEWKKRIYFILAVFSGIVQENH